MFEEKPDAYGINFNNFYLVLHNESKHFAYWVNYKCMYIAIFSSGVVDRN